MIDQQVETISGDELEKLLKDAIVVHRRVSYDQLKTLDSFNAAQEPTLSIKSGNFYRTAVSHYRISNTKEETL